MALEFESFGLSGRAVSKWNVKVGNVVEEVNFVPLEEKPSCNAMNRSITPAFVEKAAISIKGFEEVEVWF